MGDEQQADNTKRLEPAQPAGSGEGSWAESAGIADASVGSTLFAGQGANNSAEEVQKLQELLGEVELEASLRFGSREMTLGEILDLGPGDVIELDRQIHDPVELLVGDKIVARGIAVVTEGVYGLRITQVAEAKKALESIRCLF